MTYEPMRQLHGCKALTTAKTPAPSARARLQAALAVAIGRKHAEDEARRRPMSATEHLAWEEHWRKRTERALRAKQAHKEQRRTKRCRDDNPAPTQSKMWAKPMSCDAVGDTRLTMGARAALQVIRALTARKKRVSRNGLAVKMGVCARTAQRYLSQLRQYGYIRTRLIANRAGWVIAQVIEITELVLPKHHRSRVATNIADGVARCFRTAESRRDQGETVLPPCKTEEINLLKEPGGFSVAATGGTP